MHPDPFATEIAQQRLQELAREVQECHATQRRMMQQPGQFVNWLGKRFIVWDEQLQLLQHTGLSKKA